MDGNIIDIVVLENNVNRLRYFPQEALDRVAMALGYPPKVYISIEYPWLGIRSHYHYISESSTAFYSLLSQHLFKNEYILEWPLPFSTPNFSRRSFSISGESSG